MVTGYGKTLTMALLVNELQVKTLIIVPSLYLKNQLKETMLSYFGSLKNVTIENIDSKALLAPSSHDLLILDEVHHGASKTYHKLNKSAWKDIYYRIGFTATPYRNQDHEQLLLTAIAGEVIYEVNYKTAVNDEAIVPVEAYYIELPKIETDAFVWARVYSDLVVRNEHRNKVIAEALTYLPNCLCLVKEIAHGEALSELSGIPFANGQDDDSRDYIRQFNNGEIKGLIGTVGVLGEGIDTRPAEYVIIAGLGKAKSAFMQNVGRGLRKYPGKESCKVIIFKDKSHKFTLRHFNEQKKIIMDEFGVSVIKLDLRGD